MFVPIASFIAIKFITVLVTKTALRKLLENTLNESPKLKNMSDERLGCLTKSLLSQNFYRTSLTVPILRYFLQQVEMVNKEFLDKR